MQTTLYAIQDRLTGEFKPPAAKNNIGNKEWTKEPLHLYVSRGRAEGAIKSSTKPRRFSYHRQERDMVVVEITLSWNE